MTLLDRVRSQSPDKHPDWSVRLAYVEEIPLEQRETIAAMAREDADPRVRRAAVCKLMDPGALAGIAQSDPDEGVRADALKMLRDIALEAFEGIGEAESMSAIEAVADQKILLHVARDASRERPAMQALSRLTGAHALGTVARHAASDGARRAAFDRLRDAGDAAELMDVALNSEHNDTAVAAVELLADRASREQIATRGKNKGAVKRARAWLREEDERLARDAEAERLARLEVLRTSTAPFAPSASPAPPSAPPSSVPAPASAVEEQAAAEAPVAAGIETGQGTADVDAERDRQEAERRRREDQRRLRAAELANEAAAAVGDTDFSSARRRFTAAYREWKAMEGFATPEAADADVAARFDEAKTAFDARDTEQREADARARHDAHGRVLQLLSRAEALPAKTDLSLKAAERALRDVRAAAAAVPPLPTREDAEAVSQRLKAVLVVLTTKVEELREADEWQRWANAGIQEQLCARMEALAEATEPEAIAKEVRELQQQWRQAADAPRAQADTLWRRFKAAHDVAWSRCEKHFAEQAQARAENLNRKTALCERAEAVADSTNWIQTADEVKRLQADWKTIGPVSRGREKAIWERFRTACDKFFTRRHEDLTRRKASWSENLARKEALCVRAEGLAASIEWDKALSDIKQLQVEWKAIGPVKKTRSEAIWQRFRGACDQFFVRHAQRHEVARAERVAARESLCAELEALAQADLETPATLPALLRSLRGRWQQELAARGVDVDRARALDERFAAGLAQIQARCAPLLAGTEFDADAHRRQMEALVQRVEDLASSLAGPAGPAAGDPSVPPSARLAAMLKEALATNTIAGKVDDGARLRAAADDLRQAQAAWARIGTVPDAARRILTDRFQRACRRVAEQTASVSQPRDGNRPGGYGGGRPGGRPPDGGRRGDRPPDPNRPRNPGR